MKTNWMDKIVDVDSWWNEALVISVFVMFLIPLLVITSPIWVPYFIIKWIVKR